MEGYKHITMKDGSTQKQCFNPQMEGYKPNQKWYKQTTGEEFVSIPKWKATNTFKNLILLYQDYTPLSMFLY